MHSQVLEANVNRRTLLGGLAVLAAGSALHPAFVLAEGGLKGETTDEPAPDDELAAIGITGERSYQSPQFGYRLEWARDWMVDETGPGESDPAEELDILVLRWADDDVAYINVLGFTIPAANVGLMMDNAEDPRIVAELYGGDYEVEIVLAERQDDIQEVAYHLRAADDPDTQRWMMSSLRVLDDGLVVTTNVLLADGEVLADVSQAFVEGLSLDDAPLIQLLSVDAIQDAFAAIG